RAIGPRPTATTTSRRVNRGPIASRSPRSCEGYAPARALTDSLCPDVRCLDDRPPLLDFGLLKSAERFRRLLVARRNFLTEVGKLMAHCWVGQRINDSSIELSNDILGCAFGRPHAGPDRNVKSWKPGLVHGRDFGRRR